VTFLLVALLQNSQYRTDEATQQKLNAIAAALATVMEHHAPGRPAPDRGGGRAPKGRGLGRPPDSTLRRLLSVDVTEIADF
jgi:hypothetical protein